MASVLQTIWQSFDNVLWEYSHPRTRGWFLANPLPVFLSLVLWLYFCLIAGPRFMKTRKAYQLNNTLIVYNFLQICLSVYIFVQAGRNGWLTRYSWYCQPIDDINDPKADIDVRNLICLYLISKLTELLDTVFFVLRKKEKQISTLHIYHHSIMPIFSWICLKFAPGGHCTLIGWINSFIHIIMYSYYLVAGLGPEYQKYLWWKKHLTSLQLIQFLIIFWHNFTVLFRECNYPRIYNYFGIIESSIFIYMFGKFYYNSYVKHSSRKAN